MIVRFRRRGAFIGLCATPLLLSNLPRGPFLHELRVVLAPLVSREASAGQLVEEASLQERDVTGRLALPPSAD